MEIYASIEEFSFARDVIGPTRIRTIVIKLAVIVLQPIMTPSSASLDMFVLVVPYLFDVWFFHANYELLGYQIDAMMPFMPMRLYERCDMS